MRWPAGVRKRPLCFHKTALTDLLAQVPNRLVILVKDDADLVHEPDLLLIVAIQFCGASVDIGEQLQDILCCDGCSRCSHRGRRRFGGEESFICQWLEGIGS